MISGAGLHSAIFIAAPGPGGDRSEGFQYFLAVANRHAIESQHVSRLGDYVWLIDVTQQPGVLGHLIAAADSSKIIYGVLPLVGAPQFLPQSYHPHHTSIPLTEEMMPSL